MKIKEFYTDESKWCQDWFGKDALDQDIDIGKINETKLQNIKSLSLYAAICRLYNPYSEKVRIEQLIRSTLKIKDKETISGWESHKDRDFDDVKNLVEYLDI